MKNCSDKFYDPPDLSSEPPSGLTNYTDCALKCLGVSSAFSPVPMTTASVSTFVGSTSTYLSDMPLPVCTLTLGSSRSGLTTVSGTVETGPSLTATAASPSKTSGAMRTGTRGLSGRWIVVGIGALTAWITG